MLLNKQIIDVSRYVALGDSITAGYTDGALHYSGQKNSFANLLATQLKAIGGGNFIQPVIERHSVGIGFFGNSRLILKNTSKYGFPAISYLAPSGDHSIFSSNIYKSQGPFHNFGVPGAKAISLPVSGYGNPLKDPGNYNPFFARMSSDPATASVLSDALKMNPTFFSLFIGNNDILAYALSGGTTDVITPLKGAPGIGFENSMQTLVNALSANGAKGAIANIADITSVPFFTTIPYNGLQLDENEAEILNTKYTEEGFCFTPGTNPFAIIDPGCNSFGVRLIEKEELILLDIMLDPLKESYLSGSLPIPEKHVLTLQKIIEIKEAIKYYNNIIKSIAKDRGLALVDTNALAKTAEKDRFYNDKERSISYFKRGVYSLDGLHPNSLGHTLIANEFISSINTTYKTQIPKITNVLFKRNYNN